MKTFKHNLLNENCFSCFFALLAPLESLSIFICQCICIQKMKKDNVRTSVYVEINCIACTQKLNRFSHQHWRSEGIFLSHIMQLIFFCGFSGRREILCEDFVRILCYVAKFSSNLICYVARFLSNLVHFNALLSDFIILCLKSTQGSKLHIQKCHLRFPQFSIPTLHFHIILPWMLSAKCHT